MAHSKAFRVLWTMICSILLRFGEGSSSLHICREIGRSKSCELCEAWISSFYALSVTGVASGPGQLIYMFLIWFSLLRLWHNLREVEKYNSQWPPCRGKRSVMVFQRSHRLSRYQYRKIDDKLGPELKCCRFWYVDSPTSLATVNFTEWSNNNSP